jgi:hypothetical protein
MATADRTIHLGARTYALLREEAARRHLDVDATAEGVLAENLSASPVDMAELERTLERAARLRATLPPTEEATSLIRAGRDELDRRTERR